MRWLPIGLLLPCLVCELPYVTKVFTVSTPSVDDSNFYRKHVDFSEHDPYLRENLNPIKDDNWVFHDTFIYVIRWPLTDDHSHLTKDHLEAIKKKYHRVRGDWDDYNTKENDFVEFPIGATTWEHIRIYAIRRAYIDIKILKQITKETWIYAKGIDVMNEVLAYVPCDNTTFYRDIPLLEVPQHMLKDRIQVIDGKIHYTRYAVTCKMRRLRVSRYCEDLKEAIDGRQADFVTALANIYLRVGQNYHGGKDRWIKVRQWRSFDSCLPYEQQYETDYPDILTRLKAVGFTDQLLSAVSTKEQRLALRLFSEPALREWRERSTNYTTAQVDELEHLDRQWWKQKFTSRDRGDRLDNAALTLY